MNKEKTMKIIRSLAVLLTLQSAAGAVQPILDPDTGWPQLPIWKGVHEAIQASKPRKIELVLRADRDGFSSVVDKNLALNVSVLPVPGRKFRVWGQAGPQWTDAMMSRTRRIDAGESVQGYSLEGMGFSVSLEPTRSLSGQYLVKGLSAKPIQLQVNSWEGAVRMFAYGSGLELRGFDSGRQVKVWGRYQTSSFDEARLAFLGALIVAVELEAPLRRRL